MTLLTVVFVLYLIVMFVIVYLVLRNNKVFQESNRVLREIHRLADADIQAGRPWEWRYDLFNTISYEQMLFSIRPVKSFYRNHPCFLENPHGTSGT